MASETGRYEDYEQGSDAMQASCEFSVSGRESICRVAGMYVSVVK